MPRRKSDERDHCGAVGRVDCPGEGGSGDSGELAEVPPEPRRRHGLHSVRGLREDRRGDGVGRSLRLEERQHHHEELPRQRHGRGHCRSRARPPEQGGQLGGGARPPRGERDAPGDGRGTAGVRGDLPRDPAGVPGHLPRLVLGRPARLPVRALPRQGRLRALPLPRLVRDRLGRLLPLPGRPQVGVGTWCLGSLELVLVSLDSWRLRLAGSERFAPPADGLP